MNVDGNIDLEELTDEQCKKLEDVLRQIREKRQKELHEADRESFDRAMAIFE